ncbi:MAG TPA: sugar dehydrogenase [Opitutae bacterium]|nr:sugar dehydrogenase [Opitutaceae bacterium]HCR28912.1 sugar dehydrogenase [Opitutae bacterium]
MRYTPVIFTAVCLTFAAPSLLSEKLPEGLKGPIKEPIEKGDIVVAVVDQFRLPKTTDAIVEGATTHAYARIQYLNPVGDGSGRLAINDLRGPMYITDENGESPQLYMDHRDYPLSFDASMMPNETGFAGFAFHPDFSKKGKPGYGKFYTALSAVSGSGKADYHKEDNGSHESVLVEWTTKDPWEVPFKGTHRELFRVGQFAANHSVGALVFNPAARPGDSEYGLLYFSLGDGGAGFDPMDYGQSLASPHSAILRIDPLDTSGGKAYGIPEDNPFVSRSGAAPEIWAYGLRHPQHFSFDRSGKMYITEIGQKEVEEVNIGIKGANYGWRIREGTYASGYDIDGVEVGPVYDWPHKGPEAFVEPVAQYDHDEGRAVGSGFAYEGSKIDALKGKYLFADIVRGRIFVIDTDGLEPGKLAEISELRLSFDGEEKDLLDVAGYPNTYHPGMRADLRFGIDEEGEIYLLTKGDGWVRKLAPVEK